MSEQFLSLQVASVIGRDFAFRLLKSIMEIGEELRSQMTNLVGLEILYEKALYPELEYIFKHALIQEVAYNSLLKQRRREIHGSIARAIEEQYSDRLENHYESLAHHYELSGNVEKAAQYLILTGEKSNQIRAAQAGSDFLKRASQISVTAKLALDAQTEVRLLIELASAQQAVGSIGDAVKGFRKSIELSRRHALVDYEKEGLRNLLDRMPVDPGKGLAEADQRALLKRGGETIQKKRIVFHPGSGGKGKNHPPEFWRELIGKVTGRFPSPSLFRSVVLLGPAEEPLLPFFTGQVGGEQAEILFAPELEQLLSILTQAPLYVGHDSGITHLAAKLGTPTIALFKNSSVQQWRPLGPRVRVVESEKNRKTLMRKVLEEAGKCIGTQYTSSTPRAT